MSSKIEKRQRLIAFTLVNAIRYPHTLKNNIYHSIKRGPPPFSHMDTNPVLGHVLVHSVDKTHVLDVIVEFVVLEYIFFQLCSNSEQISQVHKIQKKLCKQPCCLSNQSNQSNTAFALDVRCFLQYSNSRRATFSPNPNLVEEVTCFPFFAP